VAFSFFSLFHDKGEGGEEAAFKKKGFLKGCTCYGKSINVTISFSRFVHFLTDNIEGYLRPVLKHGPRSLGTARVFWLYKANNA